ncbi:hypothetical protein PMAYCL1PPCAC_25905, partial [Pristionchus mayeri]
MSLIGRRIIPRLLSSHLNLHLSQNITNQQCHRLFAASAAISTKRHGKTTEKDVGKFFVLCRGLPFRASEYNISEFFGGTGIKRVELSRKRNGDPSGFAVIECEDELSLKSVLSMDQEFWGRRCITVSRCSSWEMDKAERAKDKTKQAGLNSALSMDLENREDRYVDVSQCSSRDMDKAEKKKDKTEKAKDKSAKAKDARRYLVQCRGLPLSAEENEVYEFLGGNGVKSVKLIYGSDGSKRGEAIVECEDEESF